MTSATALLALTTTVLLSQSACARRVDKPNQRSSAPPATRSVAKGAPKARTATQPTPKTSVRLTMAGCTKRLQRLGWKQVLCKNNGELQVGFDAKKKLQKWGRSWTCTARHGSQLAEITYTWSKTAPLDKELFRSSGVAKRGRHTHIRVKAYAAARALKLRQQIVKVGLTKEAITKVLRKAGWRLSGGLDSCDPEVAVSLRCSNLTNAKNETGYVQLAKYSDPKTARAEAGDDPQTYRRGVGTLRLSIDSPTVAKRLLGKLTTTAP